MPARPSRFTLAALVALFAALAAAGPSPAAGKAKPAPPPPPAKKAADHAKKTADAQKHENEAQVLLQAYVLLASGDHDYDGHRAKAMGSVKAALDIVDHVAFREGNVQQKIKAKQLENAAAGASKGAARAATIHEPQAVSDAALRQAAGLIQQVLPSLASHKGKKALGHAQNALKEISIALRIR